MKRSSRITKYILRDLVGPTLLGVSLYTSVLVMNAFFFIAREAIAKELSAGVVARLVLFQLPALLVQTIPMGTILGALITVGRLSSDSEIVALQSAGLSRWVIFKPVAVLGLTATLISFAIYGWVVPRTSFASRLLNAQVLGASSLTTNLTPRVFFTDIPGLVVFVSDIRGGSGGRLDGVFVHQTLPDKKGEQLFLAKTGDLYPPASTEDRIQVELADGVSHAFNSSSPEAYRFGHFNRYVLPIDVPLYYKMIYAPPEKTVYDMTLGELWPNLREAKKERDPLLRSYKEMHGRIQIHQRFALPVASFIFALLAIPLGSTQARSGKGAAFALSLLVIVVYYLVFTLAQGQTYQGRFPVVLGMWSGNIVTVAWTAWAYWSQRRFAARVTGWPGRLAEAVTSGIPAALSRGARLLGRGSAAAVEHGDDAAHTAVHVVSRRGVALIDRYVGVQFLKTLGYAVLAGYLIFIIVELRIVLDETLRNHRPVSMLVKYFRYFLPGKLGLVLPIACLVAGVVTFTILGRANEITAMKAIGISARRMTYPILLLTALLCAGLFLVQDRIAPLTNQRAQAIRDQIQGNPPRTYGFAGEGRWTFGTRGRLYHYMIYDPGQRQFQGLSVFTLDRSAPAVKLHRFAAAARWERDHWILEKGWRREFQQDPARATFETFERAEDKDLDPPENFARREASLAIGSDLAEQMNLVELSRQIDALEDSGYDTTRLHVAFHSKLAQSAAPLVMVLLGLPFAFQVGRRGSLYGLGVALLLVLFYWATNAVFNALGVETVLPPIAAAWVPNLLYGFAGSYLMLYVRS